MNKLLSRRTLAWVVNSNYRHLHKTPFFSTPIKILYFYTPVSGQLLLRTPFSRPGTRLDFYSTQILRV